MRCTGSRAQRAARSVAHRSSPGRPGGCRRHSRPAETTPARLPRVYSSPRQPGRGRCPWWSGRPLRRLRPRRTRATNDRCRRRRPSLGRGPYTRAGPVGVLGRGPPNRIRRAASPWIAHTPPSSRRRARWRLRGALRTRFARTLPTRRARDAPDNTRPCAESGVRVGHRTAPPPRARQTRPAGRQARSSGRLPFPRGALPLGLRLAPARWRRVAAERSAVLRSAVSPLGRALRGSDTPIQTPRDRMRSPMLRMIVTSKRQDSGREPHHPSAHNPCVQGFDPPIFE